ncbi:MAG TPA: aminodeoxychorismate synthase component I [Betaproteobacteria bacterium]|nr:aminodeoxychorismate synthase component I [Betaproteobacteria bacterium]
MPLHRHHGSLDLAALHAAYPERYPYLLQTASGDGWDILFGFPRHSIRLTLRQLAAGAPSFFSRLDREWRAERTRQRENPAVQEAALPFHGGWFFYLGYELLHQSEPSIPPPAADTDIPIALLSRVPAAIMNNRITGESWLFGENGEEEALQQMVLDSEQTLAAPLSSFTIDHLEEDAPEYFLRGVERIQHYIREGDVFQVNLSREWRATTPEEWHSAAIMANLSRHNPAPFAAIANLGDYQIISSSPERLVRVRGDRIETRPIAGTHPRAPLPEEDEALRRALMSSPKERAEHIMLIDLERNDLGRVCRPGSVLVDELMAVRSYAYVHHIESNIHGRLRDNVSPGSVLRALFPGGTITGCPKVRTMQIIRELENTPRLAYTGSLGYLNHDGSMDSNILIRTLLRQGRRLSFRAGAGIVADSKADKELQETRAKAKGLLKAMGCDFA